MIGIIFIIMGNQKYSCPPPRIEYRYIPKSFDEEQMERVPILSTYGKLFTKASPWELSIGYPGIFYNKKEEF
jgi:hypothetical protein